MSKNKRAGDIENALILPFKFTNFYHVFSVERHIRGVTYIGVIDGGGQEGGGMGRIIILRLITATNAPDPTFGNHGLAEVTFKEDPHLTYLKGEAVLVQADGSVLVVVEDRGDYQVAGLAKFTSAGLLDESFGEGGTVVHHLTGASKNIGEREAPVRLNIPGNYPSLVMNPRKAIQLASRSVLFTTDTSLLGGPGVGMLARFLPDGTLDQGFGEGGVVKIVPPGYVGKAVVALGAIELLDGRIAVYGFVFSAVGDVLSQLKGMVFKCLPDGAPDSAFGDNGFVMIEPPSGQPEKHIKTFQITSMVETAGNALICGGYLALEAPNSSARTEYGMLYKLDDRGCLDDSFNSGGVVTFGKDGEINEFNFVGVQHSGKVVAAGVNATDLSGSASFQFLIARFNADGARDVTFARQGWRTATIDSGNCYAQAMFVDDYSIALGGAFYRTANSPGDPLVINFSG